MLSHTCALNLRAVMCLLLFSVPSRVGPHQCSHKCTLLCELSCVHFLMPVISDVCSRGFVHTCVLSYACCHMCALSHMCALMRLLTYLCSPCALACVLCCVCVLSLSLSYVCSHVFAHICVLSSLVLCSHMSIY